MKGLFCIVLWGVFAAIFFYRGNRNFNRLNEVGLQEFESYTQLAAFRTISFFLGLAQFVVLLAALALTANWMFAR